MKRTCETGNIKKVLFKIGTCILLPSREIQEIMENTGGINFAKQYHVKTYEQLGVHICKKKEDKK